MKTRFLALLLVVIVSQALAGQGLVQLSLIKAQATAKIGYYSPIQMELSSTKPLTLKKLPQGLKAPLYGILPLKSDGGRRFHVILDEPEGSDAFLCVDANGDGDLTNDPVSEWRSTRDSNGFRQFSGGATVALLAGTKTMEVHLGMYRFDKTDPNRQSLKNKLLYYRDYAYQGQISLGGKSYRVVLTDENATGNFRSDEVALLIDLNGDSRFTTPRESFAVKKPFNIGGTTYEIAEMSQLGDSFTITKASKSVAETLPPPDHSVGRVATSFEAIDMDGTSVRFPSDFAGKVVMLDFWATWCGPCMGELPGLSAAYAQYSAKGFDVLGISLDYENATDKIRSTQRQYGMLWRQVYDGKGWQARIAELYTVISIPAAFLVDGDTGEILAVEGSLRGAGLARAVEQALEKKGKR